MAIESKTWAVRLAKALFARCMLFDIDLHMAQHTLRVHCGAYASGTRCQRWDAENTTGVHHRRGAVSAAADSMGGRGLVPLDMSEPDGAGRRHTKEGERVSEAAG